MRILIIVSIFASAECAMAQVADPNSPASRSAATAQILAGQVAANVQNIRLGIGSASPLIQTAVRSRCDDCVRRASLLQRAIAGAQPPAAIRGIYVDLDQQVSELANQVRSFDRNNAALYELASRAEFSCNRLGHALYLTNGGIAPGGNFTDPQREALRRLVRSLDNQSEALLLLARSQIPHDQFGQAIQNEVLAFARSADRVKDVLNNSASLDRARAEFVHVSVRWSALAPQLNGIGLTAYPQIRLQAARIDQTCRWLGTAFGAPPGPNVPGPLFPIGNHRDQGMIAIGAGKGGVPVVRVFLDRQGKASSDFMAYDTSFQGGVRVAVGDVNGDGIVDVITAPGQGHPPLVRVFDGRDASLMSQFYAYSPAMLSGVWVAAADVTNNGRAEIVTGAGDGGGPHVRAFDGITGRVKSEMFAYDQRLTCGARVAMGDVDGDGIPDVITAPGPGAEPIVRVFNGRNLQPMSAFHAYEQAFLGGVFIAASDVTRNGRAEIVTGAGINGGPHVRMFDPLAGRLMGEFFAYDRSFLGGVRVAIFDSDRTRQASILTAPGPGATPLFRMFRASDGRLTQEFSAFDPRFSGGAFVAGN